MHLGTVSVPEVGALLYARHLGRERALAEQADEEAMTTEEVEQDIATLPPEQRPARLPSR